VQLLFVISFLSFKLHKTYSYRASLSLLYTLFSLLSLSLLPISLCISFFLSVFLSSSYSPTFLFSYSVILSFYHSLFLFSFSQTDLQSTQINVQSRGQKVEFQKTKTEDKNYFFTEDQINLLQNFKTITFFRRLKLAFYRIWKVKKSRSSEIQPCDHFRKNRHTFSFRLTLKLTHALSPSQTQKKAKFNSFFNRSLINDHL
jgi:hypothetical protein